MKAAPFEYCPAASLDEAVALLAGDEDAKVLAGGQSLVPLMAMRLARPSRLVDLNPIPGLDWVRLDGDRLSLGAMTRHRQVERHPELRRRCSLIAEAVEQIGHVAIRNRGTVGGSLAHADPAAEWPALVLALDAELVARGPAGTRTISAPDFFTSVFETALRPDEVLVEVRLGLPSERAGTAVLELSRRHGDFAIAGVVAVLETDGEGAVQDARLALFGVGETAVRARAAEARLLGERPDDRTIAAAAEAVDPDLHPSSDLHGSAEYRLHVARVLTRRALVQARERAGRRP
ncbi:MAG TPA: xanthine dehydrogenase family protein subunit M [Candidatus Dormibacteraeota bacterium]|nr:xanthine dehydrogenase family protein subunit M [Candidatus Dormibacteraeota bacterium]